MKKKLMSLVMAAALAMSVMAVAAAAEEDTPEQAAPYFVQITGKVIEVTPDEEKDRTLISVEGEDKAPALFIVTGATVFPFNDVTEIKKDDVVTGYFPAGSPMIMIYPPQYDLSVLVAGVPEGQNYKVDRFTAWTQDRYFVSDDGTLAFTTDSETILPMDVSLVGNLVVVYGASTRSIPAQTTADVIYILPGDEPETGIIGVVPPVYEFDVYNWPIIVNGKEIAAPPAHMIGDQVMVPLRAVAEALGFDVGWDGKTQTVTLDDEIALNIGSLDASNGDEEFTLKAAPVIKEDRTFVPVTFFSDVVGMNNAYALEGQIVIDNEEKMD